ncbi:MAG: NAD-dependent epimerase/dehydratase family protein [Crocinitomicaceae bacterium]
MQNILITGGAGNVGSALVNGLLESKKYKVSVVDDLSTGNLDNLNLDNDLMSFYKVNVNENIDLQDIMLSQRFDYVFHYAAFVGVKKTQENPVKVLRDIDGIKNILRLSRNTNVKRVFFSSSSEVYGEPVSIPQNEETTPLNSRVPYAVVKNVGEAFCKSYFQEHGLKYTIFRFFNTFGPQQTTDFVMSKFISQAIKNEDITIFGDGLQSRTFCYIDDNIEATIKTLENDLFINDVVNLGGDKIITVLELARLIIKQTGSQSKIKFLPPLSDGDMTRRQPDNTKMLQILNRPLLNMEEGINKMLQNSKFMERIS